MPVYTGNAICSYVREKGLNYYFSAECEWLLLYGDQQSIPKLLVFASQVPDIGALPSRRERDSGNRAYLLARYFRLPMVWVRFMLGNGPVSVWTEQGRTWARISYDQLRELYDGYGVVQPGAARKPVNQYTSSPYQDWQRGNLGPITVSDLDLIRYEGHAIREIIELKRSKFPLDQWEPFRRDFPNFALLINAIQGAQEKIPFRLYYNLMEDGPAGARQEDISQIKVFQFTVPDHPVAADQVRWSLTGVHSLEQLLG